MMKKTLLFGVVLAVSVTAAGGRLKFTVDQVDDIVGEVQKPDVTVVISRENLNKSYELKLEESFIDRVIESVEHAPF